MKNILIISTDLNRENDPDVSLSIASLLCYLKSAPSYGQDFIVEHHSVNEIKRIHLDALVSLQTRFENIRGKTGEQFLELCSQLNVHLEFGVQSINASEYIAVNRPNKLKHIEQVIKKLNGYGISYEISLIYGLPNQTYKSFLKSIDYFD